MITWSENNSLTNQLTFKKRANPVSGMKKFHLIINYEFYDFSYETSKTAYQSNPTPGSTNFI